jgi:hypothetical protein
LSERTELVYSKHFKDMLRERDIDLAWVEHSMSEPEMTEEHDDGTRHYLRKIPERDGRWLRVVVNTAVQPNQTVTVFFDRRLRTKR